MAVPQIYQKPDSWPHLFAPKKDVNGDLIEKPFFDHLGQPQLKKLYHCTHCELLWWQNADPRPLGACPKRIDMLEQRRLRGMR